MKNSEFLFTAIDKAVIGLCTKADAGRAPKLNFSLPKGQTFQFSIKINDSDGKYDLFCQASSILWVGFKSAVFRVNPLTGC